LDSIIRLRGLLEERQEAVLKRSQAKLNDCKRSLESLSRIERELACIPSAVNDVRPAIDLHVRGMRRQMVTITLGTLRTEVEKLGSDVGLQREKLRQARQDCEKVETIRDSARELWLQQKTRKQQRWMDEMYLLRRRRG
jgi:flagellar export protein FliJ